MFNKNKNVDKEKLPVNKFWQFIRKNGFSVLMGGAILIMLVNPDARTWVLRQLLHTGIFNAKIETKAPDLSRQTALDFDFKDIQGNIHNTASLRGKVVFINFWASWCPPCRAEFPSIETLYSKFSNHPDIFFLTINEDNDHSAANNYLKREKYSVPYYKTNGNVPGEIYAGSLPTTILLDKKGTIRYHHTGFANYASGRFIEQLEALIKEK